MNDLHQRLLKEMTPEKKLKLSSMLFRSARELKLAYLRKLHPDWSEEQLQQKVKECFLYARTD